MAEAEAALATLDEAVASAPISLMARDGAILRLIYTYEAVWKACQHLLDEQEGIEVGSPNGAIRAARRLAWISDEEAQAITGVGQDRNFAVHMYRSQIGEQIAARLGGHAAVLRRWLEALKARAGGDC